MDKKKGGAIIKKMFIEKVTGDSMVCWNCGGTEFTQEKSSFQDEGIAAVSAHTPVCMKCGKEYKKQNDGNKSNPASFI